ncbi:MAG: aminopeptidase [Thermoprotei archaeon]|nr:MAG: aminopeptidase [Thermoprotei archaeon]RLF25336.1 MAG: aminopeptidase [Thermoprotei archaeon]
MKIFIMTDLEGATGVCGTWQDINPGGREHERARRFLTRDVNAAIEGAYGAGAKEVVVLDGHGAAFSIIPEELDERAKLIRGRRILEMEGLDPTFDAVFAIGAHAMAGTPDAILPHTLSSVNIVNIWLNNIKVGEIGLWAAIAGTYNVPLVLVTGDEAAVREAKKLLGDVECVAVKKATSPYAAICLHPNITYKMIREAAVRALTRLHEFKPFRLKTPIELRVEYTSVDLARRIASRPGVELVDGRTVRAVGDNIIELMSLVL